MKRLSLLLIYSVLLSGCAPYYSFEGTKFSTPEEASKFMESKLDGYVNNVVPEDAPLVVNEGILIRYPSQSAARKIAESRPWKNYQGSEGLHYVGKSYSSMLASFGLAAQRANMFERARVISTPEVIKRDFFKPKERWELVAVFAPESGYEKWILYSPSNERREVFDLNQNYSSFEIGFNRFASKFKSSVRELARIENKLEEKKIEEEKARIEKDAYNSLDINPAKGSGPWRLSIKSDPITDANIVTLVQNAKESSKSFKNDTLMVVRCSDSSTELYVDFDDYMTDSALVSHRIDKQQAKRELWGSSTDKTALFYPSKELNERIKVLLNGSKFVVRATPYNESPKTLTFDIRGIYSKLKKYKEECGWDF